MAIAMPSTGVCDWIPGLPSFHHSVSQPIQPLPPGCLQISPVWVKSLSKKGLQELLPFEAEGACLVARKENPLPPACLGIFTCTRTRGTGRKSPVTRQQCWTPSHHGFLLGRGLRPRGPRRAQPMRNMYRLPQGGFCSSQQLAYPHMAGTGTPQCLSLQHRNPSPRSDGDLQPRKLQGTRENDSSPHTATLEGSRGCHSQWASLHGLVAGPHQEGNRGQVTEPVWSGPGWSVLQQPTAGGDVQTPNCGPLNETSYLVCETEEQGGQCGVRIAIPYPW